MTEPVDNNIFLTVCLCCISCERQKIIRYRKNSGVWSLLKYTLWIYIEHSISTYLLNLATILFGTEGWNNGIVYIFTPVSAIFDYNVYKLNGGSR